MNIPLLLDIFYLFGRQLIFFLLFLLCFPVVFFVLNNEWNFFNLNIHLELLGVTEFDTVVFISTFNRNIENYKIEYNEKLSANRQENIIFS